MESVVKMTRMAVLSILLAFGVTDSSTFMTGGWHAMEPRSAESKEIAHKALADRNSKTNGLYHDTVIRVVEAESQVVNGINYKLKMYIGQSTCSKKEATPAEVRTSKCRLNNGDSAEICTVNVYEQPWTNKFEVYEFSCQPSTRKEALKA